MSTTNTVTNEQPHKIRTLHKPTLEDLSRQLEDRDSRDVLLYQTICAVIHLLDIEADSAMVTDVLRLARDSMPDARAMATAHLNASEVAHG